MVRRNGVRRSAASQRRHRSLSACSLSKSSDRSYHYAPPISAHNPLRPLGRSRPRSSTSASIIDWSWLPRTGAIRSCSSLSSVASDRELPGFGVRVHPSGSKVYRCTSGESRGKPRRVTIGRHGVWSLDATRREAGGIVASLKNGETPTRPGAETASASGPKIAELGEQYMAEHVAVRRNPTTAQSCRHISDKYLLP